MADGQIIIDTHIDNEQAQKELEKLKRDISKLSNSLSAKKTQQTAIEKEMQQADRAVENTYQNIKRLETELAGMQKINLKDNTSAEYFGAQQRIPQIMAELEAQRAALDRQGKAADGVAAKYDKVTSEVNRITQELNEAQEKAGHLSQQVMGIGRSSKNAAQETSKVAKEMQRFKKRVVELTKSALIFSVMTRALTNLRESLAKTVKANNEAAAAIGRLKGALATLAAPIINSAMPALISFINLLARVVATIAMFTASVMGETYSNSVQAAEGLESEKEALEGVGGAASQAAKQLANFDEINKLAQSSGGFGGGSLDDIKPLFDAKPFEGKIVDFVMGLAVKINELLFDWDKDDFLHKADKWITVLSGILGAVIGASFGGISGAVIGLLLGVSIGIITCEFTDELKNENKAKKAAITVLSALIGAVLGAKYGGIEGAIIGLVMGIAVSIISIEFMEDGVNERKASDIFNIVLDGILFAVIGAKYAGFKGAVIGLLFGVSISIISAEFLEKLNDKGASKALFNSALTIVMATAAGAMWGGWIGAAAGLTLGIIISFASVNFDSEISHEVKAAASTYFYAAFGAIMGGIIGFALGGGVFGGIIGAVIGLTLGLSVAFDTVDFVNDTNKNLQTIAAVAKSVLTAIMVAAIAAALSWGNPLITIAAGVITLGMSLAINLNDVSVNNKTGFGLGSKIGGGGQSTGDGGGVSLSSASVPALAQGAVIPPNRSFLAILGDQRSGTNIEAPLSTIEQAVRNVIGANGYGGSHTVVLELDGREFGRATYDAYNKEAQRVGVSL